MSAHDDVTYGIPPEDQGLRVRALIASEEKQLAEARIEYAKALALDVDTPSTILIEKVDAMVGLLRTQIAALNKQEVDDRIFLLAVAWGDAICEILHWSWMMLDRGQKETPVVVSPDEGLVAPVFELFRSALRDPSDHSPSHLYWKLLNDYCYGPPGSLKVVLWS